MKILALALLLPLALTAQTSDGDLRIVKLTNGDMRDLKDADEVIALAEKHKQEVQDAIYRSHGMVVRPSGETTCYPYDVAGLDELDGGRQLLVRRVVQRPDKDGKCISGDGSDEGMSEMHTITVYDGKITLPKDGIGWAVGDTPLPR